MQPPAQGETWLGLTDAPLDVGATHDWAVRADCGAVVLFSGTVRNHAEGREGVQYLTYEAYEEQAASRLAAIADEVRTRWPDTGRIALVHRVGRLELGEPSVLAVVSAPHRGEAFAAARYAIDALKATVPIWKHEVWDSGSDWSAASHDIVEASTVEASTVEGSA